MEKFSMWVLEVDGWSGVEVRVIGGGDGKKLGWVSYVDIVKVI